MTTSQGAGTPAQHPTGAPEPTVSEPSSVPAPANADTSERAPLTGRIAAPPDGLGQLEAEIERTREQLGETVRELIARTDVKRQARAKVAELRVRAKDTTSHARATATAGAVSLRGQVAEKTTAARQATPDQVQRAVKNGVSGAKERWIPLTVVAGVLVVACVALRQWRRSPDARPQRLGTQVRRRPHPHRVAWRLLTLQTGGEAAAHDRGLFGHGEA